MTIFNSNIHLILFIKAFALLLLLRLEEEQVVLALHVCAA